MIADPERRLGAAAAGAGTCRSARRRRRASKPSKTASTAPPWRFPHRRSAHRVLAVVILIVINWSPKA